MFGFEHCPWCILVFGGAALAVCLLCLWVTHRVPRLNVKGKIALITGGSMGIGLEVARELHRRGAHVIVAARREGPLKDVLAQIANNETVDYCIMDVSDQASVSNAFAKLSKEKKFPEIVVCCAGFAHPSRFIDTHPSIVRRLMDVNYFGCVHVVREALPWMLAKKSGRFVFTSSMAASASIAGLTTYAPTKAAVRAFAQSMDMEYACLGVRFQVFVPPDVKTPGFDEEMKVKSEECRKISGPNPFSAKDVAQSLVAAIENYSFQATAGFEGHMLTALTACTEPPTGAMQLVVQVLLSGVLRLVAAAYTKIHYGIVADVRRKER